MVGVALWWLGVGRHLVSDREQLKACSHMAAVLPDWQGRRVGLRLKLAQRRLVLEQGFTDWITWTYDPLYRPNGVFNIHRLGSYLSNLQTRHLRRNAGCPQPGCAQ